MLINSKVGTIEKIGDYKLEILRKIISNDKLAKLLYYNTQDALFRPNLTEEQKESLLYSKVYPYRFVPNPVEDQGTFITIGVGNIKKYKDKGKVYDDYHNANVYFYIFTHMDLMRTYSGIRQDVILAEISKEFDGEKSKDLGMGEFSIDNINELWLHNNKFGGYTVAFNITDLR